MALPPPSVRCRLAGGVLLVLGVLLTAGLLTLMALPSASVLPPGEDRRDPPRRARWAAGAIVGAVDLWGGNAWWEAEAESYRNFVRYRPFATTASVAPRDGGPALALGIRDERWSGTPVAASRYNALLPDHGKLMHLSQREAGALATHPVAQWPRRSIRAALLPRPTLPRLRRHARERLRPDAGQRRGRVHDSHTRDGS
jgi:hypothetical protein